VGEEERAKKGWGVGVADFSWALSMEMGWTTQAPPSAICCGLLFNLSSSLVSSRLFPSYSSSRRKKGDFLPGVDLAGSSSPPAAA
jgi:hypothetical protein